MSRVIIHKLTQIRGWGRKKIFTISQSFRHNCYHTQSMHSQSHCSTYPGPYYTFRGRPFQDFSYFFFLSHFFAFTIDRKVHFFPPALPTLWSNSFSRDFHSPQTFLPFFFSITFLLYLSWIEKKSSLPFFFFFLRPL